MAAIPDRESSFAQLWDGFLTDTVEAPSAEVLQRFTGKRVLLTGAGGYLGSALAHALSGLPVERLVLLDVAEYGLYRLEQDLAETANRPKAVLVVGSVRDRGLLRELLEEHAPQIVFHAAALKHVPLMEDNPFAAAETNVLGTRTLVEEASRARVESFVFLSTDKAVAPISIMGATKRIAEQIVLAAPWQHGCAHVVRLCNVLGSTGSVAPLFARQILRGRLVTVTDPQVTRYFLSETDAVRHLLGSAVVRTETGLLVPAVGAPRRIEDLARFMIQRATSEGAKGMIVHTGLRVADKLHEELLSPSETTKAVAELPSMYEVSSGFDRSGLEEALAEVQAAVEKRDQFRLMRAMQKAVPEYRSQKDCGGGRPGVRA